jgi:beta-glucosidase
VPDFKSYAMKGRRTATPRRRRCTRSAYGLSYTRFAYRDIAVSSARVRAGETVTVSATVENVGR